ncbi:MAG TPA: energy transducer TonB [Terriglobales bacterium]|nr:energy transducer TonB [Terriglobales bacterium]
MTNAIMYEQLDQAINLMFAAPNAPVDTEDRTLVEMMSVARELRLLPSAEFKDRLLVDLEARAHAPRPKLAKDPRPAELATLASGGLVQPQRSRMNVVTSVALHALAVAAIVGSGYVATENKALNLRSITLVDPDKSALPPAPDLSGGGGGGGDRSKLEASQGALPKPSLQQITPPAAVIRNDQAKLEVPPSIVVPPNLVSPALPNIGDPTSRVSVASNGTGSGGGIGAGDGGGIGAGTGRGLGPGTGGGTGGGVFRVGGGVTAPRAIYSPDPDYSEEARKAKVQGAVVLWMVVGQDGRPRDIRVQRSLGMGLDEKAMEAVRTWRFQPAMKDGQAVSVQINVEVMFRLY